jgi:hypothetical protein
MELNDYLKSNCRSWEYDCDNYNDTITLANHLQTIFPDLSFDYVYEKAKHWTGFNDESDDNL